MQHDANIGSPGDVITTATAKVSTPMYSDLMKKSFSLVGEELQTNEVRTGASLENLPT